MSQKPEDYDKRMREQVERSGLFPSLPKPKTMVEKKQRQGETKTVEHSEQK